MLGVALKRFSYKSTGHVKYPDYDSRLKSRNLEESVVNRFMLNVIKLVLNQAKHN